MKIKQHIFLIGMMCSGKSSVAPLLSKHFNIPYIDTDQDLISILDANIEEIFNQLTEKKFRELESTYFLEHIKKKQYIYATGGGVILMKENQKALQNNGITVFLNTSLDIIFNRLNKNKTKNRPLFKSINSLKDLEKLWEKRKKYYYNCSDIIIQTRGQSINKLSTQIVNQIQEYNNRKI